MLTAKTQYNLTNAKEYFEEHLCVGDYYDEGQRVDEVSPDDCRQLFETNFWGVYNGSMAVLPHLRINGGALINLGSEVSESAVPLQGMYSASKHAVKGFTDALRIEVEVIDQAPISITLIEPTATNTPFPQHAKNYMQQEPKLPPALHRCCPQRQ